MEASPVAWTQKAGEAIRFWGLPEQTPALLKYRENAVFRVVSGEGQKAALRLHRPAYHTAAALESELVWMADLRGQGMNVPQPITTPDGRLLVPLGNGLHADLIGWVEGDPLGESGVPLPREGRDMAAIFHAIGERMARMHEVADRFTPPPGFERPAWDAAGLLGAAPFWGRFWDCDALPAEEQAYLARLRGNLAEKLAALVPVLDYGLIHADLVRENVFVQENDVAFIDFDDCGFGFRLFDLATMLLRNRREPDFAQLREAALNGYLSRRPQTREELRHLPLFLLLRGLTYIGWAAARPELPDNAARLRRYVADVRALADEGEVNR